MADWQIERLGHQDDRSLFSCGKPPLDDFILKLVSHYEKTGFSRELGFQPLLDADLHLYLSVATIRDAFDRRSGKS